MKVKTKFLKIISDIHTPVGVYLKLRDLYSKVFLLESSDYKGSENSLSFICFDSKAQISVHNDIVTTIFDSKELKNKIIMKKNVQKFDGKSILITGGTGSFGKSCVKTILDNYNPKKITLGFIHP